MCGTRFRFATENPLPRFFVLMGNMTQSAGNIEQDALRDSRNGIGSHRSSSHGYAHNLRILDKLVKIVSVVVCLLLAVFFICVITNVSSIQRHVETVRTGSYPISVAAGHLETYLVRLETVVEHLTNTQVEENDTRYLENSLASIDAQIREQLDLIDPIHMDDPARAQRLKQEYDILSGRLNTFTVLCWQPNIPPARTTAYAATYLYPLIDQLLEMDTAILDEASADVNDMYDAVRQAIYNMTTLSLIIIIGVIVMIGIYMSLLRAKNRLETELRNNLEDALSMAKSVNEAKSTFLSNMSHDIRTPMNAIIGLTTIANDNIDDTLRVKQCLTRIATSSQYLLSLINDVLDMNKIESGKVELADEKFSLSDFVSEIVTIIQGQPNIKKLRSEIIVDGIQHEHLIGDAMRLRQVILNLTSNAIKYTNEGDLVSLMVSESPSAREGWADFTFVVKDTGIGMKKDFLRNIFEPFEREHNDYTNFTEGTGLGMAITKNLVDLMGGSILVESEFGEGTTVTIRIPLRVEEASPADEDDKSLQGLRVLVVDENNLVMNNTVNILKSLGMRAEGTTSGEEAIEIMTSAREAQRRGERNADGDPIVHFDALIIDEHLSDMSGIEAINRMHEILNLRDDEEQAAVILSSYGLNDVKDEAEAAGVHAFLAKPLFRSRLIHTLQKALNEDSSEEIAIESNEKKQFSGRVLVVEDNEINMEIATTFIGERGPQVEEAVNGLEAVTKVSDAPDGHYDLIFMDWRMPHMDGLEATKAINKFLHEHGRKHIPIVAMTANAFDTDRKQTLDAGMDDFMAKPINIKELESMLAKYLG